MDNSDEQGQEEVGKKQKANKDLWKRNQVKVARLKGGEYVKIVNSKGITVPAKATGPNCRFPTQIVGRSAIEGIVAHTFAIGHPARAQIIFPDGGKAYPLEKVPIKQKKIDHIKKLKPYVPHNHEEFYIEIVSWPIEHK